MEIKIGTGIIGGLINMIKVGVIEINAGGTVVNGVVVQNGIQNGKMDGIMITDVGGVMKKIDGAFVNEKNFM